MKGDELERYIQFEEPIVEEFECVVNNDPSTTNLSAK